MIVVVLWGRDDEVPESDIMRIARGYRPTCPPAWRALPLVGDERDYLLRFVHRIDDEVEGESRPGECLTIGVL